MKKTLGLLALAGLAARRRRKKPWRANGCRK